VNGKQLRAIRQRLGLTQAEFARKIMVHSNHLAKMERGETPITDKNAWFAQALDEEEKIMASTGDILRQRLYGQVFPCLDDARRAAGIASMDVFTMACRRNRITVTGTAEGLRFHDKEQS